MEIFWKTIAEYNNATWAFQLGLIAVGIVFTVILIRKPSAWIKLAMKIYHIALCLWIAVVYYMVFCAERKFNDILALFWGILALLWLWDAFKGYTTFERTYKYNILAYILLVMPFIYPLFSLARGLSFPGMTSPIMPCSVAVFSIGILLLFSKRINMFIALFLCHWSIIAISKTYFFKIPEDFLLAGTSAPAIYLYFKEYFTPDAKKVTKPDVRYINLLLLLICICLGALMAYSFFAGLNS